MYSLSKHYTLRWQFKEHPHYQISTDRTIINTQRGTQVKRCVNGGSIGYWIAGQWYNEKKVNQHVEIIPVTIWDTL